MSSSRRNFTACALILPCLPLLGCNSPPIPPRIVQHRQGRKPVDSAREFLELRHKAANDVLDGFIRYRHAVIDQAKSISASEIAWAYEVMEVEQTNPSPKTLREFIDSPEGAYLSAQDKEFLDRLEHRFQQQIQDRLTSVSDDADARRLPSTWSNNELFVIYGRLEATRRFIQGLDQPSIGRVVTQVVGHLAQADRDALARGAKTVSGIDARAIRTDDQVRRWTAVLSHIQPALEAQRPGYSQRPSTERQLIDLIVNQALFFAPFAYSNAAVALTRFNDFAEAEQGRLNRMVFDELRRV